MYGFLQRTLYSLAIRADGLGQITQYRIEKKFCGRKFRDFAQKQAFHGINFTICVDILRLSFDVFRVLDK